MLPSPLDDAVKLELEAVHKEVAQRAALSERYPVDFEWLRKFLKYSTKGHAKTKLISDKRLVGEYIIKKEGDNNPTSKRGRPCETIMMTVHGFKHFCMAAQTDRGEQIRDYYCSLLADNVGLVGAAAAFRAEVASGEVTVTANSDATTKRLQGIDKTVMDLSEKTKAHIEARRDTDAESKLMDRRRSEWKNWRTQTIKAAHVKRHKAIAAAEQACANAVAGTKRRCSLMLELCDDESVKIARKEVIRLQTVADLESTVASLNAEADVLRADQTAVGTEFEAFQASMKAAELEWIRARADQGRCLPDSLHARLEYMPAGSAGGGGSNDRAMAAR
jgi:hypothetical protein